MIDWRGKKIIVMGLGLNQGGLGVVKWLLRHKYPALVTDLKTAKQLRSSLDKLPKSKLLTYRLGEHRLSDFQNADIVIRNPGVADNSPYLAAARRHKALIINEAVLFFELCQAKIVGITGTRGKSSTSWFAYQLLKACGLPVYLTGNIAKTPMLALAEKLTKRDIAIVELSSWHLQQFWIQPERPDIAVLTNIYRDHLNRHSSYADYIKAKQAITAWQTPKQIFITNKDDAKCVAIAEQSRAKKIYFGQAKPELFKLTKLMGQHNAYNIDAVIKIAETLGVSKNMIRTNLPKLKTLPMRLQTIATYNGCQIINDSTSTMPDATLAALKTYQDREIILICGGQDKELDYLPLAKFISKSVYKTLIIPGTGSDKLIKGLKTARYNKFQTFVDLSTAVKMAIKELQPGNVLLFSPGGASFNQFINEFNRGDIFNELIKHEIKGK